MYKLTSICLVSFFGTLSFAKIPVIHSLRCMSKNDVSGVTYSMQCFTDSGKGSCVRSCYLYTGSSQSEQTYTYLSVVDQNQETAVLKDESVAATVVFNKSELSSSLTIGNTLFECNQ